MSKVKRADMVSIIAKEAQITTKAANTTINLIYEFLRKTVSEEKAFVIPNVGVVKGFMRPARTGINPKTGEKIFIKEKLAVKIRSHLKPTKGDE